MSAITSSFSSSAVSFFSPVPLNRLGQPVIAPSLHYFDPKDSPQDKVIALVISLMKEIRYASLAIPRRLIPAHTYHDPKISLTWKVESRALYVFVHGLKGHPSAWNDHISNLKKEQSDCDYYAPFVPHGGACTLEEASEPLFKNILSYADAFPGKPVCFIGVSNGGRIALNLSNWLAEQRSCTPIKVSILAGALFGTPLINDLENLPRWILDWWISPVVRDELRFGSPSCRELLQRTVGLKEGEEISYEFFATPNDALVTDMRSALPKLGLLDETHHIREACGHNSIVSEVYEEQLKACAAWIEKKTANERINE